jgi:hypothetical protein
MPNNREWAILIWLGVFLIWAVSRKDIRQSLGQVLRAAATPKILLPLAVMLGYIVLEAWLGSNVSLWRGDLTKDTIVWVIVSALVLFVNFSKASTEPHFFRRRVAATVGVTEFLAFFTNLFVLSLIAELFLQPFLALLAMLAAYAGTDRRYRQVKRLTEGLLAVIGLLLLILSVRELVTSWSDVGRHRLLLQLALPIWLTIALLPFVYLLGLFANYELVFMRIDQLASDRKVRRRAKLALLTKFYFRARESGTFAGQWYLKLSTSTSFEAARAVIDDFRESEREKERAAEEEQDHLQRYTGSDETDVDGRRLDRREFKETISALQWLATCQMGWYRNERQKGRYRRDLLEALGNDFTSHGLPHSGIVMRVAKNGQAWYAWRRTVTGWCFAIGAAGPPGDQWEYDGPEPPQGFPGKDRRWGSRPFSDEVSRNWRP